MKLDHLFFALFPFIFSFSIEANDLITPSLSPSPFPVPSTSSIPLSYISSRSPDSTPSPSPSADPNNNPSIALKSHLKSAAREANIAIVVSNKLLRDPNTAYMVQSCLSQCVENYTSMADDLTKAIDDLHFYMLSEDLSAIEDEIAACQECFTEMVGGNTTPLKPYEDSITAAATESLAILENYTS